MDEKKTSALLLGDSISLQYRELVKFLLKDVMEIIYPPENGRMIAYTFRALYEWSRDFHWSRDINFVYWNNGLWDVTRIFGDEPQTPLKDYKNLIGRTYGRLRYLFPKAKIIFATTTPVVESRFEKKEIFFRSNEEIRKYNEVAAKVIVSKKGFVHDLYSPISTWTEDAWADSTHFVPQAANVIGVNVANLLKNFLESG